jgi:hypothetical protein
VIVRAIEKTASAYDATFGDPAAQQVKVEAQIAPLDAELHRLSEMIPAGTAPPTILDAITRASVGGTTVVPVWSTWTACRRCLG